MRDILNDLDAGRLSDPDPARRAQKQMLKPLPKRFYKEAGVAAEGEGFAVTLDGRLVRTPGRHGMILPTEAAARLVADEYGAQGETINPMTMPVTRLANTAIDGVAADMQAVAEDIQRFSSSDLLCYRAGTPERLVARQTEIWNPVLEWVERALGARFVLAEGVMHVDQPGESIGAVGIHLRGFDDPFRLAALHSMTTLTGSALLALAAAGGGLTWQQAWTAAHVDEDWNIELWGEDAEAMARRKAREREMEAAWRLLDAIA